MQIICKCLIKGRSFLQKILIVVLKRTNNRLHAKTKEVDMLTKKVYLICLEDHCPRVLQ